MNQKHLFTVAETAAQIGMGITKTRELIGNGRIRSVRIGRAVRVPSHAIAEFIQRLEEQAQ